MKLIAIGIIMAPITAAVVAVLRVSQDTIDGTFHDVLLILAFAVLILAVGLAVRWVLQGSAEVRAAPVPRPSHQIDNRRQAVTLNAAPPAPQYRVEDGRL